MQTLSERFRHKIKTREELVAAIGRRPRAQTVILCHGVFDVVHPGHLRHLLFAKSRADILVCSLTADLHISKALHRPHVPQDLRALNLAAFEMVDFVIVDANPTPVENLKLIQPDYFAKGYEYFADGLPPKTREEAEAVESYGGQIVFTPGDVVYSSSALINAAAPNLNIDKLLMLMEKSGIGFADLHAALGAFRNRKVHVVGDTIIDSLTHTSMIGGQTKTPTMSVLFQNREDYIGGAAIVAAHLAAAGAKVVFSTVLGNDKLRIFVIDSMNAAGVDIRPVIDALRPTTRKNAIVAGGYRLLKIDTLDNSAISDVVLNKLTSTLRSEPVEAVVFSDFRHGIFNKRTLPHLISAIPPDTYKVADSQVASRWGNITEFPGFDMITPNEREARFAMADQDHGIRPLAASLYDAAQCKFLILKLGDRGILAVHSPEHRDPESFFVVDSFVDRVVDAVGAGDALLAYSTLAMLATGSQVIAAILGSIAAACECEREGNIPITPADVQAKLKDIERRAGFQEL